jgi:hypothetical protein
MSSRRDVTLMPKMLSNLWLRTFPTAEVTRLEYAGHFLQKNANDSRRARAAALPGATPRPHRAVAIDRKAGQRRVKALISSAFTEPACHRLDFERVLSAAVRTDKDCRYCGKCRPWPRHRYPSAGMRRCSAEHSISLARRLARVSGRFALTTQNVAVVRYVGIGLAAGTAATMPIHAGTKRRIGNRLHAATPNPRHGGLIWAPRRGSQTCQRFLSPTDETLVARADRAYCPRATTLRTTRGRWIPTTSFP